MAFLAKDGPTDLGLERHLIVFAAMIANDLETRRSVLGERGFLRTAFGAPLWCHHVALVKVLLLFFSEKKNLLALNTRNLYIRHLISS